MLEAMMHCPANQMVADVGGSGREYPGDGQRLSHDGSVVHSARHEPAQTQWGPPEHTCQVLFHRAVFQRVRDEDLGQVCGPAAPRFVVRTSASSVRARRGRLPPIWQR